VNGTEGQNEKDRQKEGNSEEKERIDGQKDEHERKDRRVDERKEGQMVVDLLSVDSLSRKKKKRTYIFNRS
jgi:hypothetical protein